MTSQTYLILPEGSTEIPKSDSFIRIDRLSIIADDSFINEHFNQRVSIMAHVSALTSEGLRVNIEAAIASFIIGLDFDRTCNILLSPSDECTLSIIGAPTQVQLICTIV